MLTQPPVQWVSGLFPGGKQPERGTDHPHTSSAKVVHGCSYTYASHLCVHGMSEDDIYILLYTPNFIVLQFFQLLKIKPSGLS